MNRADNTVQNTHFSVNHKTMSDGRVKTTTPHDPSIEVFSRDLTEANRKVQKLLIEKQANGELAEAKPRWMAEGLLGSDKGRKVQ